MPLADALGTAGTTVGLLAAAAAGYRWTVLRYRRTLGSRRALARDLDKVAAGVTSEYVDGIFGRPTFLNRSTNGSYEERTYRTRHAWLKTVNAIEDSAVVGFSITVTDPEFRFDSFALTIGNVDVAIGSDSFAELGKVQYGFAGAFASVGARRTDYREAYWGANAGGYQFFLFAHNDAGTGMWGEMPAGVLDAATGVWSADATWEMGDRPPDLLEGFRSGTAVNTLAVIGPMVPHSVVKDLPLFVNLDVVRVLMPPLTRPRRQRRRPRR